MEPNKEITFLIQIKKGKQCYFTVAGAGMPVLEEARKCSEVVLEQTREVANQEETSAFVDEVKAEAIKKGYTFFKEDARA